MGKRKGKQNQDPPPVEGDDSTKVVPGATNRNYVYSTNKATTSSKAVGDEKSTLLKVQIPTEQETALVDLILEGTENRGMGRSVSRRLSIKKLTDLYNCLQNTGFKHKQIEQAMSKTVACGGDIMDALDWLCLNTPNDQLPAGFSQTFCEEENKKRPKFDANSVQPPSTDQNTPMKPKLPSQPKPNAGTQAGKVKSQDNVKNWILQYAELSSEDEEELEVIGKPPAVSTLSADPNEKYLELTAMLLDAKADASEAKLLKDKPRQNASSKKIQQLSKELSIIEEQPGFDPQVKIKDIDKDKTLLSETKSTPLESKPPTESKGPPGGAAVGAAVGAAGGEEFDGAGFAMFDEPAPENKPKPKEKKEKKPLDKREFGYTRQQWTGKSPKQFLIDWVRKHLPKSPPPSYNKVAVSGAWRSKCTVKRQNEGNVVVCPDIVTENLKDAEHLASTLALYHLCKGQRVYQLLPPPYRDVFLEWKDAEEKAQVESKIEENKPRDQLITRLMQRLKIDVPKDPQSMRETSPVEDTEMDSAESGEEEDVEETWEDLISEEEEEIAPPKPPPPKVNSGSQPIPKFANVSEILNRNLQTEQHARLLESRRQLPVFASRSEIVAAVRRNQVVVIAGETGSGKSTQIPQFILEDAISSSEPCNISCTEPRRISAISLAMRVSEELGEKGPGSRNSLCGYQIRLETKKCPTTRLLYSTTGVLLRKLQQDSRLRDLSHIIVDEVHERSVESDFLIIILKQLLRTRADLRVVLMSATLDSDKISAYFGHCPVLKIPGKTFPVEVYHIEDVIEQIDYHLEEDSPYALRYEALINEERDQLSITGKGGDSHKLDVAWSKENISKIDRSGLDPDTYGLKTRNTVTRMNPERINIELVVELLGHLDRDPVYSQVDGAVLAFMPGLSHIQELYELLTSDRRFADKSRYKIIPLHSVLSSQDQSQAFNVPPKGVRKIVIATNIAETGITIPDVVFVIDTGKVKEKRYIETSQMSSLEEVYVSKASAKQRQGRAGRVREGICFRAYTKHKYSSMKAFSIPEMLRVPLEELCLHIMKCNFGNPSHFLAQALDPPLSQSVTRAMSILREVGACVGGEEPALTPLGHHLAALPVDVRIGKMLIFSAILGCLEPMCVIAAAMTDKSPFVVPMGKRDQADDAKKALAVEKSDHLTLYKAYLGWKEAQKNGYHADLEYCQKCFLKRNSLIEIENVSRDLLKVVQSVGFQVITTDMMLKKAKKKIKRDAPDLGVINISEAGIRMSLSAEMLSSPMVAILKAVLSAGLYPRLAQVVYTAPVDHAANPTQEVCVGQTPQGPAAVHPSSVNRYLPANGWLVYMEKVKTHKIYLRDTTLVSPYPILLFGGTISVQHGDQIIAVDDWIKFKAYAKTAVIFKELRLLIDELLERKLKNPALDLGGEPVVRSLLELLVSERQR